MSVTSVELKRMSATQLVEGFARREFSPVEVLKEVFAQLDRA